MASGIIELPLHHPVTLAKQLTSIDQVSRGRLIVGVGAGYLEAEFATMGVQLSDRGLRMDENLDVMRALWTMRLPQYSGRFVSLDAVNAYPRPVRDGGLPIILGGESAPARRRAIAKGNGWYCFQTTIDCAKELMALITAEIDQQQRPVDLGRLEITMTPVGPFDRSIRDQYESLGVDRLVFLPGLDPPADLRHAPVPVEDILRTIDRLAATTP